MINIQTVTVFFRHHRYQHIINVNTQKGTEEEKARMLLN